MKLAIVAHRDTETNAALVAAGTRLGITTLRLEPREALTTLERGDLAVGRLDVRETLDGIEDGMRELEKLAAAGITLLNPPAALAVTHDKLLTARMLRRAGLPHPHTWLIADGLPVPVPELPVVLKPRFGSWGRGVTLCRTHDEVESAARLLWTEHGVLAQELIPPLGWDVRVVVAGGRAVGAARRIAAEGEWRTNVALGGRSVPYVVPPLARSLAVLAADAAHADLVGVDLLPMGWERREPSSRRPAEDLVDAEGVDGASGWVIAELNGAVDFRPWYGEDVYGAAVRELLRTARARRTAAA
jgi:RimK family alpha-L-glutamate ligase